MQQWLFLVFQVCFFSALIGQRTVFFENPSFEDKPGRSRTPYGWYLCEESHHSPPDIHPQHIFSVTKPPADGRTYLGMVARADGSAESIEQVLSQPLAPGCYRLDFFASRSDEYFSYSVPVKDWVKFDKPLHIAVYGNHSPCSKKLLLGRSSVIEKTDWQGYTIILEVPAPVARLQIQVEPPDTAVSQWHGSVLIDGLSPLVPVDGESGSLLVKPGIPGHFYQGGDLMKLDTLLKYWPKNEVSLSTGLIQQADGQLIQMNAVLFTLASWAAGRKGRRLVWALDPNVSDRLEFMIHRAMHKAGLPEKNYRIRRKRRLNKDWAGNAFLKVRLK